MSNFMTHFSYTQRYIKYTFKIFLVKLLPAPTKLFIKQNYELLLQKENPIK